MALDESMRFSVGSLFVKDYGAAEFTEIVADQTEEGAEFNYSGEMKEVKSANQTGAYKRLLIGESASVKIGILLHQMELLARSFGHDDGDIVDDTVSTPKTKTLEFGGPRDMQELTVKIESPQPINGTLKDILTLYRVTAKPEYSAAYKIGGERYVPVTFEALADVAGTEGTAKALGSIVSQYE